MLATTEHCQRVHSAKSVPTLAELLAGRSAHPAPAPRIHLEGVEGIDALDGSGSRKGTLGRERISLCEHARGAGDADGRCQSGASSQHSHNPFQGCCTQRGPGRCVRCTDAVARRQPRAWKAARVRPADHPCTAHEARLRVRPPTPRPFLQPHATAPRPRQSSTRPPLGEHRALHPGARLSEGACSQSTAAARLRLTGKGRRRGDARRGHHELLEHSAWVSGWRPLEALAV